MATITVIPKKDNVKSRKLAKQMAFWDRKRSEYAAMSKSRSVEEIIDSIFGKPEPEQATLSLRPTKHHPSSDNRCLNDVAIYSTTKHREKPRTEFGITARA